MPGYKLIYHDGLGKAEVSRLMFKLKDVAFEDVRIAYKDWPAEKPSETYNFFY